MTFTPTVLVVDDNQQLLSFLELLLESNGFQPTLVESPVQAALLAQTQSFDCLITDVRMPQISGPELATEIRLQRFNSNIPVIFISGQSSTELSPITQVENSRFLRKPFTSNDLILLLKHLLDSQPRVQRMMQQPVTG